MGCTERFAIELIVEDGVCEADQSLPVTCDGSGGISIALDDSGPSRCSMLVSAAGPNRFRIEEVCGLLDGLRYLDVIEAQALGGGVWRCLRVVERARCRQVTLLLSGEVAASPRLSAILDQLVAHGGAYEQVFGGVLTVAVPRGLPFNPLTRIRRLHREEAAGR